MRNRKYFNTEIMIPDDPINLPGGDSCEINTLKANLEPNLGQILIPKGILKIQPKKQTLNHSQEIFFFENFSKPAKKALREAFILQKQLNSPTSNQKLADFINLGQFKSNKNTLFHQHTEDSIEIYGRRRTKNSQKKVRFSQKWDPREKNLKN